MTVTLDQSTGIISAPSFRGCYQWTVLEHENLSSSVSEVDFDVSGYTEFRDLRFDIFQLTVVTNAAHCVMLESTDGGSSYASSYDHCVFRSDHGGTGKSPMAWSSLGTRANHEFATGCINTAYGFANGYIEIYNWQSTTEDHLFKSLFTQWQTSSNPGANFSATTITPSAAATDYRIAASSGNLDGGDIILSGRSAA